MNGNRIIFCNIYNYWIITFIPETNIVMSIIFKFFKMLRKRKQNYRNPHTLLKTLDISKLTIPTQITCSGI